MRGIVDKGAIPRGEEIILMPVNDRESVPVVLFKQQPRKLTAEDSRAIHEAEARRERRRLKRLKG